MCARRLGEKALYPHSHRLEFSDVYVVLYLVENPLAITRVCPKAFKVVHHPEGQAPIAIVPINGRESRATIWPFYRAVFVHA